MKNVRVKQEVKVFAPATVANVICGYDILGFALDRPGDEVIMRLKDEPGVEIVNIEGDDGLLPRRAEKNTVSASVQNYLKQIGQPDLGIEIELFKQMPIGSGLGSSAASTVAGLFAINQLLGEKLTRKELLPLALKGEELACGYPHADNVAPSLLGGFTLVRSYEPLDVIHLPVPPDLHCAVVFPHVDVPTRDARDMIRKNVPLKGAVKQWGNIAGLVSGLFMNDYDLISRSMEDVLIEPTRAILIPEFYEMRKIAMEVGALSFGISGSGPSVFSFTKSAELAAEVAEAIKYQLNQNEIECNTYISSVNTEGPKVL
ncbi:homoserine kinase [Albibacterium profundi]|uniref:Homoserine kinase n=1 Tax=Albibacterium profundi TaxID=3134906 RepID=A0ABV5CG18_9SPHI